jgi:dTDP-4-amino-4,6-dideoxygalactose transaminase
VPHQWEFNHDAIGYNYRMPNLNAALACAQLEQLPAFVANKRELAQQYAAFFKNQSVLFVEEPMHTKTNYWLNAILLENKEDRNHFLEITNGNGVMTRPVWELMTNLPMFKGCQSDALPNSRWLADRLINIPSSVRL